MRFLLEQSNVKLSDINEDIWDKSGEKYQPLKDSKYLKLQKKPINTLSLDDIKYLYVINRASSSFIRYDSIEQAIEREIDSDRENSWDSEIFEECYKYLHSLKFPLTIYRAIRTDEINEDGSFNISGSNNSRSWSTNINIYKDKLSSFKSLNNIVSAKINADIINNSATIVNYYFYTGSRNVRKSNYGEYEITLKKNFKQNDLQNLHFIDKDSIIESFMNNINEKLEPIDMDVEDLADSDMLISSDPYDIKNYIINNTATKIAYLPKQSLYVIIDPFNATHWDVLPNLHSNNIVSNVYEEMFRWYFIPTDEIDSISDDGYLGEYSEDDFKNFITYMYGTGLIVCLEKDDFKNTSLAEIFGKPIKIDTLFNLLYTNNINEELSSEQLKEIKDYFGTTYYKSAAFYLLQDGTLLDGSDYKNGSGSYTRRVLDHRDISDVYNGDMYDFINEGNIRLMPESPGISIMKEPTKEQYATLKSYIDNYLFKDKVFYIDILNSSNGDTIKSFEYSWPENKTIDVLNDLVDYFKSV